MTENEIATIIVDVAYKIHQRLGPGLMESVYKIQLLTNWESLDYQFGDGRGYPSFMKPFA